MAALAFLSHGYSSQELGPARARRNARGRVRFLYVLSFKSDTLYRSLGKSGAMGLGDKAPG